MAGPSLKKTTTTPAAKRTTPANKQGSSAKKNTSILSFFQKTDGPRSTQARITQFGVKVPRSNSNGENTATRSTSSEDAPFEELFVEDKRRPYKNLVDIRENWRSNTKQASPEKPKLSNEDRLGSSDSQKENDVSRFNESGGSLKRRKFDSSPPRKEKEYKGPFIDESDSEDDIENECSNIPQPEDTRSVKRATETITTREPPPLVRENTSNVEPGAVADDFEDIEDDELECEDFMERPWTEGELEDSIVDDNSEKPDDDPACPICQASLAGQSDSEASVHVNACLDGNPQPLPEKSKPATAGLTRLEKAAIPKPAQRNPFAAAATGVASAFTKLMASNAEDSAWAAAAANEVTSRGKQAYERTCPFYKILPGFSITVDAFRYGAVEGCEAYFLSHFHSDHYGGLTSSWRHGPIYCSKVTGNLVRQQIKVDPKYIVDLEYEKKTEVPGTKRVYVTMITANHCPGSSLFLFEKVMDSGRVHRILHCGDFRACPAHVQHPLLRPDVVDQVSGKSRQQRIDVCYLDTTYLNPKYAFPGQDAVISACAAMCVQLNDESGNEDKALNVHKIGQGTGGISKFFLDGTNDSEEHKKSEPTNSGRLLVVIGTYSIGKERICLGIARALKCKIYAPAQKQRICACLEDPELSSFLTTDPLEAQIHMQILFEIRAETLADYLQSFKGHFTRVVGFRPTGWTYRAPGGRLLDNPPVANVLHSNNWKTSFSVKDLVPQRGSTKQASCFGVPYSEHSSFRELTMFCCALRIGRVIPTVNVGNAKSREKMKAWFDRWEAEKKKSGLLTVQGDTW
ncbi:DNA repair metallo-beta-lactamase-domain-containing protein [Talaromyces proteolyticus]|uniref:DNA repair metallo-beta-lactamase-domain-containing protein n=1 Tax=Talaromyces proteolyticus TaxID=1131652 RepID=A0AAD4PS78_9EURO|nr:DNA repair metallo-beta-lactamase-domain-containing protein [Talaromyces proteolyticus]KAH8690622.1 DNA repair metallo-beta-lactamase-domain-containing protein [Talaromyces proteolyticus]